MNTQNQCCEGSSCNGTERGKLSPRFRCAVDIVEQANELVLYADVPGSSADAIDISLEDGVLSVRAAVKDRKIGEARLLAEGYRIGDFVRSFRLSETIDPSGIQAEYVNGVLVIRLPKAKSAQARKISVTTH